MLLAIGICDFVGNSLTDCKYSLILDTFSLFMSLTTVEGKKSWKAFSVFIFSLSKSLTFSITSLAKICKGCIVSSHVQYVGTLAAFIP